MILNIETSTNVCSVALSSGSKVILSRESQAERSHASVLTVFIDEVMKEAGKLYSELSAVSVSKGPGSYTGLRIGVSAAKGICYGADVPLLAVDTLRLMAAGVYDTNRDDLIDGTLLCPMIDARRMEVYTALYDVSGNMVREIRAEIIDENSFSHYLEQGKILFFGDGSAKCREIIQHPNAAFIEGIYPSAGHMADLSQQALSIKDFEDTAYFEPFYLKDFIATQPKKNLLGNQ